MYNTNVETEPEHNVLDIIAESLTSLQHGYHEGSKPGYQFSQQLLDFALQDPASGWLKSASQIDPDSIKVAADRLEATIDSEPALRKFTNDLEDLGVDEQARSRYSRAVKRLCELVHDDAVDNEGVRTRSIVRNTDLYELDEILSNEDLREWLRNRPGKPNIYDLQVAVVKATILNVAEKFQELLEQSESNPFSEN